MVFTKESVVAANDYLEYNLPFYDLSFYDDGDLVMSHASSYITYKELGIIHSAMQLLVEVK